MSQTKGNRVIAAAQILDIRLVSLDASSRILKPEDMPPPTIRLDYGTQLTEAPKSDGAFSILAECRCRIEPPEGEPYVVLTSAFELLYRLPAELEYSQEELKSFAETNAVFNVWPYFREIIQSTLGRMRLPQIMLPLYRVGTSTVGPDPNDLVKNRVKT